MEGAGPLRLRSASEQDVVFVLRCAPLVPGPVRHVRCRRKQASTESKPRKDGGPHVVVRQLAAAGLWRCDDGGDRGYVGGVLRGRQLLCYNPVAVMAVDKLLERVHNTVDR